MKNIIDISSLKEEFKSEQETQKFIKKQHDTINALIAKNKELSDEITQLKQMLIEPSVERIIITPEQALIDTQIEIIQNRSYHQELSLEDVKKLDLLLKNKILIKKDQPETLEGKSKPFKLSNAQLLEIASQHESK